MRIPDCVLLLAVLGACPLPAQRSQVLPDRYGGVWAGNNGTGTALGTPKGIVQTLYPAPFAAPQTLIFSVGFRRNGSAVDYAPFSADMEVVVSSSAASLQTLSATFAANLGPDATAFLPRQVVNVPAFPANSSPGGFLDFPVVQPFVFGAAGPNLLVQVKCFAPTWTSIPFRVDRCFAYPTSGNAISFGAGCGAAKAGSTAAGSYMPGTAFELTLAGAPAGQPALALIAADLWGFLGVPLPLDLSFAGMTGCLLLVPPALSASTVPDAAGAARLGLQVPNDPWVAELAVGAQWLYGDPAAPGPLKLLLSDARALRFGPIPCQTRYVYDLFDETKTTGSLQAGGPVARFRVAP